MDSKFSNNIPHYNKASDARKAAIIILGLIEKAMSEKPQEFLEFQRWDLPQYGVDDQEFMDCLPETTLELAYSWVRTVLRASGWDFDSEKEQIIPIYASLSEEK